jgi:hypothetical protein
MDNKSYNNFCALIDEFNEILEQVRTHKNNANRYLLENRNCFLELSKTPTSIQYSSSNKKVKTPKTLRNILKNKNLRVLLNNI